MKDTIILLSGLAGSGKTTAARYISEKYNIPKFSLGDVVKQILADVSELFNEPIKLEDLYKPDVKNKYRVHMQKLGTDILRERLGPDVFNIALENKIYKKCFYCDPFIIDDIRFLNELNYWFDYAEKHHFKIIHINIEREGLKINENSHISERQIGIFSNFNIVNNGTKEEFYKKIDEII